MPSVQGAVVVEAPRRARLHVNAIQQSTSSEIIMFISGPPPCIIHCIWATERPERTLKRDYLDGSMMAQGIRNWALDGPVGLAVLSIYQAITIAMRGPSE